ncbi:polyphosphate kinase 2 [Beijerinckia indica]|uniref:ADP/GDP-polyphosphate phosphotransferase n=1 Tax=Beijerinckia indica subsp. indica (strain ATCC 9039 / DSM 1715 / NCIMB 8712) TaxID=395963 RepID=B2IGN2_BEII9|nr:polyphosphate kinase 2 [Beijerinckia indica]ACB95793.1 protein of unknown function DUF344 [Beijerinckia indica subsp. indica ATCC 9039]
MSKSKKESKAELKKAYEKELARLQVELVKLQFWIKKAKKRAVVVFEGRDAAGKGGIIKRMTERVSPRVFRIEALPMPSERQRSQLYFQRYIERFPAAGEIVIFDRSWYNRAGVEHVMGFCTKEEYERFLRFCPSLERDLIDSDIQLIKYWLEVSPDEQTRRFESRINEPCKVWKLSPMDLESHKRWFDYSRARDAMFAVTDTDASPWHVVPSDDKKSARINCLTHFLSLFPYEDLLPKGIKLPKREDDPDYVPLDHPFRIIPDSFGRGQH